LTPKVFRSNNRDRNHALSLERRAIHFRQK
jgi:hypothetical protein